VKTVGYARQGECSVKVVGHARAGARRRPTASEGAQRRPTASDGGSEAINGEGRAPGEGDGASLGHGESDGVGHGVGAGVVAAMAESNSVTAESNGRMCSSE
jgi:hypothetical protein